jgi:hypothetical protein
VWCGKADLVFLKGKRDEAEMTACLKNEMVSRPAVELLELGIDAGDVEEIVPQETTVTNYAQLGVTLSTHTFDDIVKKMKDELKLEIVVLPVLMTMALITHSASPRKLKDTYEFQVATKDAIWGERKSAICFPLFWCPVANPNSGHFSLCVVRPKGDTQLQAILYNPLKGCYHRQFEDMRDRIKAYALQIFCTVQVTVDHPTPVTTFVPVADGVQMQSNNFSQHQLLKQFVDIRHEKESDKQMAVGSNDCGLFTINAIMYEQRLKTGKGKTAYWGTVTRGSIGEWQNTPTSKLTAKAGRKAGDVKAEPARKLSKTKSKQFASATVKAEEEERDGLLAMMASNENSTQLSQVIATQAPEPEEHLEGEDEEWMSW